MSNLFAALSAGLARFSFAWILPALVGVGLFATFLWPHVSGTPALQPVARVVAAGPVAAGTLIVVVVLSFSAVPAYLSLPIYQVLEGILLPRPVRRALLKRQRRAFARTQHARRRFDVTRRIPSGYTSDSFLNFPSNVENLRATALGNRLAAMESWSSDRYQLDSQTMWYELLGVADEGVRKHTDEGRAPVDFFVSAIVHGVLLGLAGLATLLAVPASAPVSLTIALLAWASVPASYRFAVHSVVDWTSSVKALVNLSRRPLAEAMGLDIPPTVGHERRMWNSHHYAIELNERRQDANYDKYRRLLGREAAQEADAT